MKTRKLTLKISTLALLFLLPFFSEAQSNITRLSIDSNQKNDMSVESKSDGEWEMKTTGKDPWVLTKALQYLRNQEANVLSFEYFCPIGINSFQVFFGMPAAENRSKTVKNVGISEGWVGYTVDLNKEIKDWGKVGDILRLDFGNRADVNIHIRNILIRPMTEREKRIAKNKAENLKKEQEMEARINTYLHQTYPSEITKVLVSENQIIVKGKTNGISNIYLNEITPFQDLTEEQNYQNPILINSNNFELKVNRFVKNKGINYDRLLSKWAITQKTKTGYILKSHAHYPDSITSKYILPKEVAKGKKGIGGFSVNRGHISDLEDLDITSATINIWFARFMFTTAAPDRIEHSYNGKSYYFRQKEVEQFDSTLRTTARKGIITAGILLVDKAEKCPDPIIGKLLQHPDMDPAGIYSMPNMTTPESVDCYAAALDFLASRYSRPDKKYGRMNHWIMHNEVDAGWEWTNMGEKTAAIFMDTYIKSMRMCYAIARSYNPHSEVFITLTHYWAWTSHPHFYPSKQLMERLIQYSKVEGDFEWAMAHHPYPQSLREPKTWLDKQVDFTYNSQLITFKNLEVLNAWIKRPEALYKGKTKRTLWLSENGTDSKTYSEQDLFEQAAGFAYTWKKMKELDGIDGFQWHNWIDNRNEGGLRIGLRRFPDDESLPGGKKPVWEVFKAADTNKENEIFDQYKKIIGIADWEEVRFKGQIK